MITLSFHGGARTVTGSKYLLSCGGENLLIDCGMFQGLKELRMKNWEPTPFPCTGLDGVVLTHCHIDHCGYLPRLVRQGFTARVHCTPPTAEILPIMLADTAKLQEEDAAFFNRAGLSQHTPALPLFTQADVEATVKLFTTAGYGRPFKVGRRFTVRFLDSGHILGAAIAEVSIQDGDRLVKVVFSGDVGRYDAPMTPDPEGPPASDYLVIESTYGDRLHTNASPHDELTEVVQKVVRSRGVLLIPAFAVGRTQQILFILKELQNAGRIPTLPIHLDSPMAFKTTDIYLRYLANHQVKLDVLKGGGTIVGPNVNTHRTADDSRKLDKLRGPAIIISASGMMSGGRVLRHAGNLLPLRSTVLALAGFQAEGTRGRRLLEGEKTLKIFGALVPVEAEVVDLAGFSGHADYQELLTWTAGLTTPPKTAFVTHGETGASEALAAKLRAQRRWNVVVPTLHQAVEL
ncbi:MAG: MBL fold metallo-hydrolase [Elusimicrobia bacterium]|nr:MBL fold metallo-hydrolase [Elusimicrobiota bacterium]